MPGCYNSTFGGPISNLEPPRYTHVPPYTGTHTIIPVVVDKNFSPQDKTSIDNAINSWNYVLNGYMVMMVESYNFDMEVDVLKSVLARDGIVILKVYSDSSLIPGKYTLAWANDIGGNKIWVVRDRFYLPDTYPIMLHELGHILGAEHEEDIPQNQNFLMFPHYERGKYNCIDGRAMQKVARYQLLFMDRLNYCY
jgi:hypothetical protein